MAGLGLGSGDLVVEIGAGSGVMTLELARTGAEVVAVEPDPVWVERARDRLRSAGVADRVRLVVGDARGVPMPSHPYRVAANLPFGLTTELLAMLLDHPQRGPERADVIVQREVAVKHSTSPPVSLRTAAWVPWWTFERGLRIDREAFRPRPSVDAQVLTVRRRPEPVLPVELAPGFGELLRPGWPPR